MRFDPMYCCKVRRVPPYELVYSPILDADCIWIRSDHIANYLVPLYEFVRVRS